jgi:hypothetical protein
VADDDEPPTDPADEHLSEHAREPQPSLVEEPATPTPAWRRLPGLSRFRSTGAAIAAIVGVVTAVFGAYVGYRSLPQSVSLAEWQRQVNSVCEQSGAEMRAPLRNLGDTVQNITVLLASGQYQPASADLVTTARDLQDNADAYKSYIGQARALERPDDSRVDAFLDAGVAYYKQLETIANDLIQSSNLVAAIPTDGSGADAIGQAVASLQTAIEDVAAWQSETNVAYERSVLALDLEQCPGWNDTGKPLAVPTPAPLPSSPPSGLDPTAQAVARSVGISPDRCRPIEAPADSPGTTVQLNCQVAGLQRDPAILGFDSEASLTTWFTVQPDNPANCGAGESAEYPIPAEWGEPGRIKCTPLDTGFFRIDVMLPARLVGIGAEAAGPTEVARWVQDFVTSLD